MMLNYLGHDWSLATLYVISVCTALHCVGKAVR